jgi:spore germination protein YaaH
MKKIILFFLILGLIVFFYLNEKQVTNKPFPSSQQKSTSQSPTIQQFSNLTIKQSLFLPYWSLPEDLSQIKLPQINNQQLTINSLIYFGITPDENGINQNEAGYLNLSKMTLLKAKKIAAVLENSPSGTAAVKGDDKTWQVNALLTLRMTNSDLNLKILDDVQLQQKIIDQTLEIAKQNSFGGIVLDLELAALPFQSTTKKITNFIKKFSQKTKFARLNFAITIYGDTFFRKRPYDLKNLTPIVDQFYVMAYDFHKANGNPGPNFPLNGREKYGYDLSKAADDFLSIVPSEKLIFIFGLYGYDWTVDEKERPIKQAKVLTLNQIKIKFSFKNSPRDSFSQESFIKYTDENKMNHVVWFEDEESIAKKQEFLKSKNITNFAYWAWGYY